ncbi:MAG: GNAT family N-acetyltransferase [Candidatus Ratteibacteria bacterium]|jgi:GNAT superfamily N-acetyltransferase
MKFGDELDKYVILKLPLNKYADTASTLKSGFRIAGPEVRKKIRNEEKKLLKLYFRNWMAPYYGNLNGWKINSPIYILYQEKLVSGLYFCDQNEFGENGWGQTHYLFTDPEFKGRGLHRILFKETMRRVKSWGLQGVIINTDRYLLPEIYIRWGATTWKEIKKVNYSTPSRPSKRFSELPKRLIRALGSQFLKIHRSTDSIKK